MSEKGFIDFQNFEKALQEKGVELSSSELSAILELINLRFDEVISKSEQQAESFAKTISELNKTIASLNDIIETLKGKNNRNASNSNKPSSWDHFSKPTPKPSSINAGNGGSKKTSGGQKGHSGTTMKVLDTCVLSSKNPWANHQGIPRLITGNSRVLSSAQESLQISRS